MSITKRDAGAAAELVAKGLSPKLRPARDAAYLELVERYRTDVDFRELTDEIAAGLGLAVLDAGLSGIVLGPEAGSVFALRLSDYRKNLSVKDRMVHGLIHVGIAAWCYPTAAALLDDDVRRVTVNGVERYLREAARRLEEESGGDDPDADRTEFEMAWRRYLRIPATRDTGDGRRTAYTTAGMIAFALQSLADQGLMQKESDEDGGTWRALDRYRVQVRELAATEAWRALSGAGRGEEEPPCST